MEHSLDNMYVDSEDLLKKMMDKLFPKDDSGCINFGYWELVSLPISKSQRIDSQKRLYEKAFEYIPKKCKKALEVGCGRGHGVNWLRQSGIDTYGVDILKEQIEVCKKNYPQIHSKFNVGKSHDLPFQDACMEVIYSVEAAQHFPSFAKFCNESCRVLKKNGLLIITTYFFLDRSDKKFISELIPNDIAGFDQAITVEEALNYAEFNGFTLEVPPVSIGKNVFPYYSQWQKQALGHIHTEDLLPTQVNWAPYFTGGGILGEHPWGICYRKNWLDYNILVFRAKK